MTRMIRAAARVAVLAVMAAAIAPAPAARAQDATLLNVSYEDRKSVV